MQHWYKGITLYTFIIQEVIYIHQNKEHNLHSKLLQEGLPIVKLIQIYF